MMTPIESNSGMAPNNWVDAVKLDVSISKISPIIVIIFSTILLVSPRLKHAAKRKSRLLYWHKCFEARLLKTYLLTLCLTCSIGTVSAEVYRIVKPDGSVEYTDQMPAQIDDSITELDLPEWKNSSDTRAITRGFDKILKVEARERAANKALHKRRQNLLAPLRLKVTKAKQALLEGSEKREGDYISNSNGGTRLSPSYLSRVAALKAAVTAAEDQLSRAERD